MLKLKCEYKCVCVFVCFISIIITKKNYSNIQIND